MTECCTRICHDRVEILVKDEGTDDYHTERVPRCMVEEMFRDAVVNERPQVPTAG